MDNSFIACVFVEFGFVLRVACLVRLWVGDLYVNSVGIRYSEVIHICCFV